MWTRAPKTLDKMVISIVTNLYSTPNIRMIKISTRKICRRYSQNKTLHNIVEQANR